MTQNSCVLPEEVGSAVSAAAEMYSVVRGGKKFWLPQILFLLAPVIFGLSLGMWFICNTGESQKAQVVQAVSAFVTVVTVLAGFVVTLMLFTGRTQGADRLSLSDADLYINKIVFLQFSQILTLIIHLLCVTLCILWLLVQSVYDGLGVDFMFALASGLMVLSLLRTLIMPFQIFEVHYFELNALRAEKAGLAKSSLSDPD